MTDALNAPRFVIRPALPLDTDDVLEFTRHTWEGDDYIPYVWHDWLVDLDGFMIVAEYFDHAVGLGRLTCLAPGQWWLEGLRVNPEFEGRGIGSRLNDYLINHWLEHGDGILRLATDSFRSKVHHLCERSGFTKVGECTAFLAPVLPDETNTFTLIPEGDILTAVDFAKRSPSLQLASGLMDLGWRHVAPNEKTLAEAVGKRTAYWWRGQEGLLTIWEDKDPQDKQTLLVGLAACKVEMLTELLLDFRRLAAAEGYSSAAWFAPLLPDPLPALEAAGFKQDWDSIIVLYEKKHPQKKTAS